MNVYGRGLYYVWRTVFLIDYTVRLQIFYFRSYLFFMWGKFGGSWNHTWLAKTVHTVSTICLLPFAGVRDSHVLSMHVNSAAPAMHPSLGCLNCIALSTIVNRDFYTTKKLLSSKKLCGKLNNYIYLYLRVLLVNGFTKRPPPHVYLLSVKQNRQNHSARKFPLF